MNVSNAYSTVLKTQERDEILKNEYMAIGQRKSPKAIIAFMEYELIENPICTFSFITQNCNRIFLLNGLN